MSPDLLVFKYSTLQTYNMWDQTQDVQEFALCLEHHLKNKFNLTTAPKNIMKGDILMRNQRVDKNNIILFYVAMRSQTNTMGYTVVGKIDPMIHKLDHLFPFLRKQTALNWTYDLNGEQFKKNALYQQKQECANLVQEFLCERINDWQT